MSTLNVTSHTNRRCAFQNRPKGVTIGAVESTMPHSSKLASLIALRKQIGISANDVAEGMAYNDSYVRRIEADSEPEPLGFAHRYELGLLRALIKKQMPAEEHFGTSNFRALLDELSNPKSDEAPPSCDP